MRTMQLSPDQQVLKLHKYLPELLHIQSLAAKAEGSAQIRTESYVVHDDWEFPLTSFSFGAKSPTAPVLIIVGGVHGLERIGTALASAFIKNLLEWISWDDATRFLLDRCRVCVFPLANPAGMYFKRRSNMNGVDLMRNAPVDAEVASNVSLIAGHRISPRLPWYRGLVTHPIEHEAAVLANFVRQQTMDAEFSMVVDLHSGFGLNDRLWFPYAYSKKPFHWLKETYSLKNRLDRCLPNHVYVFEPQSRTYITHGDLWDYLSIEREAVAETRPFLPLTLEMGSWTWIKKNPRQLFSALGVFNPVLPHRVQRTLRRHVTLLEFLFRATASWKKWASFSPEESQLHESNALRIWYERSGRS